MCNNINAKTNICEILWGKALELLACKLQLLACSPRGHIKRPFWLVFEMLGLSCVIISDLPGGGTVSITLGSQLFSPSLTPVASCGAEDKS